MKNGTFDHLSDRQLKRELAYQRQAAGRRNGFYFRNLCWELVRELRSRATNGTNPSADL